MTFSAIDVTDGDLPIPGSAVVTFSNSTNLCPTPAPVAAGQNGYVVTPQATGFIALPLSYGGITYGGCPGVSTPAFLNDQLYITDWNGGMIRLDPSAAAVSSADRLAIIGPTLMWPVASKGGKLYAAQASTGSGVSGRVVELDPITGAIVREVASNQACPFSLAIDPVSGDLFFDGGCSGFVNDAGLHRIRNPDGPSPTVELYLTLPGSPNGKLAFSPDGTLYAVVNYFNSSPTTVLRISGTNSPLPPTITPMTGVSSFFWVHVAEVAANGAARSLIVLDTEGVQLVDITGATPTKTLLATNMGGGEIGPDGCLYAPYGTVLYKLTDAGGGCSFGPAIGLPSLRLGPVIAVPNPAQGSPQPLTASFRNLTVPANTPVFFTVRGANPRFQMVRADATGKAVLQHVADHPGRDLVTASATVDGTTYTSNRAEITWTTGPHVSFLSVAGSPRAGVPAQAVAVTASLADLSADPTGPAAGASIDFALGDANCTATTDARGVASCQLTPTALGALTLQATFAGTSTLLGSSDAITFVTACPAGFDGVVCHLTRFRATLTNAAATDVKKAVRKSLLKKTQKLQAFVAKAQVPGKKGEKATKKLRRKLDGLTRQVQRFKSKKMATALRDTLVPIAQSARSAVP